MLVRNLFLIKYILFLQSQFTTSLGISSIQNLIITIIRLRLGLGTLERLS